MQRAQSQMSGGGGAEADTDLQSEGTRALTAADFEIDV
jgi:hypothetical protein